VVVVGEEEEERTPRPAPSEAEMSPRGHWSRLIAARCVLGVAHMVPPRVETCSCAAVHPSLTPGTPTRVQREGHEQSSQDHSRHGRGRSVIRTIKEDVLGTLSRVGSVDRGHDRGVVS
jgi:hypothetical protein